MIRRTRCSCRPANRHASSSTKRGTIGSSSAYLNAGGDGGAGGDCELIPFIAGSPCISFRSRDSEAGSLVDSDNLPHSVNCLNFSHNDGRCDVLDGGAERLCALQGRLEVLPGGDGRKKPVEALAAPAADVPLGCYRSERGVYYSFIGVDSTRMS